MTAFTSLHEFFAMGGHGLYVWAAWGVTALILLSIVWHARLERRQLLRSLKRRARREKQQGSHYPPPPVEAPVTSSQWNIRDDT